MRDCRNYNLLPHNTFGLAARCERFVEFSSLDELKAVASELRATQTPILIIGRGSNILFTKDFEGIVLHSAIKGIQLLKETDDGDVLLRCGSGETWDDVVKECVERGYYGAENLSLIPGEVGASAVQNIGAYGVEVKDLISEVEVYNLHDETVVFKASDCGYGYRDSIFKHEKKGEYVVTHVTYRLSTTFRPKLEYGNIKKYFDERGITNITAQQLRNAIIEIRRAKLPDPEKIGNAGSFFKNPVVEQSVYEAIAAEYPNMPHYVVDAEHIKIPAGWLIEQCGWKGKALHRAAVHDRQALVLINKGGATGEEICHLAAAIRADVRSKFGIDIQPEVNIL